MPHLAHCLDMSGKPRAKKTNALPLSVFNVFKDITNVTHDKVIQDIPGKNAKPKETIVEQPNIMAPRENIPLESGDTSESEEDKKRVSGGPVSCPMKHDGRLIIKEVFSMSVDQLYNLIATDSPMLQKMSKEMNYTDMTFGEWEEAPETGLKTRVCHVTVPITQPLGPKCCHVTDKQILRVYKPGELYVLDKESVNSGVPYCDSFYILTHYCLTRISDLESTFVCYVQIVYRKSVWGLVKGFIERNVWSGFEDYMSNLRRHLHEECGKKPTENGVEADVVVVKGRVEERIVAAPVEVPLSMTARATWSPPANEAALWVVMGALLLLLLLNGVMYYKLMAIQTSDKQPSLPPIFQAHIFGQERSHEQWVSLVQKQAAQHQLEIHKWKSALKSIVSLLKQAEGAIVDLQTDIHSSEKDGLIAALKPLSNTKNDEL